MSDENTTSTSSSGSSSTSSSGSSSTESTSTTTASSSGSSTSSSSSSSESGVTVLQSQIAQPSVYFYPGEILAPDQMRVTLVGSGMGNIVRRTQADCSIFVELGNGDSFIFDLGIGSLVNYNSLMIPFSRMAKVFLTHLHMDHMNDLSGLYAFGPSGARYEPLQVWGPSGQTPELGLNHALEGMKQFCRWHTTSFAATQPIDGSYEIQATELDFRKNPGIAYQANGVTITHWPALHTIDGAISYRLDWNGLSFVWSGDTVPNHFFVDHAKGADLIIHETFPTLRRYEQIHPNSTQSYEGTVGTSHTTALCFGKVMSLTKPRMAVTNHCVVDDQELSALIEDVRVNWKGAYQIGSDFMVFNVSKDDILVRRAAINTQSWGSSIGTPSTTSAPLDRDHFLTPAIWDQQITDCQPGASSDCATCG